MGRPKNKELSMTLQVRMPVSLYRIAKKNSKKEGVSSVPCYVRALLIGNEPISMRDLGPSARKFISGIRNTLKIYADKYER